VRDGATQEPVENALVQVYAGQDEPLLLRTDAQGRFLVEEDLPVTEVAVKMAGYLRATQPITGTGLVTVDLEPFEARAVYVPFGLLTKQDMLDEIIQLVDETELNS